MNEYTLTDLDREGLDAIAAQYARVMPWLTCTPFQAWSHEQVVYWIVFETMLIAEVDASVRARAAALIERDEQLVTMLVDTAMCFGYALAQADAAERER